eukprot:4854092-Ditylum_brightwellii.AAC.1
MLSLRALQKQRPHTLHTPSHGTLQRVVQFSSPLQWLHYRVHKPSNITRLPKTVVELFITHHALCLNELEKVNKRHWKGNVRTAYSKRQYVYEK